ncbi:MAG: hypothetical protein EBT93_09095 [Alphaproteobacteria bacterium]|nr:hypothetical protein [Alphaproteobacteria bacterium]
MVVLAFFQQGGFETQIAPACDFIKCCPSVIVAHAYIQGKDIIAGSDVKPTSASRRAFRPR